MEIRAARADEQSVFAARTTEDALQAREPEVHIYGKKFMCTTDHRGHSTAGNRSRLDIVLDATEGFVPLWGRNLNIRWRFDPNSMHYFQNPEAAKHSIRGLFAEAIAAWGDAAPIRFTERYDAWDFELSMSQSDNCGMGGCTLARAFFPDPGRHQLVMYPMMFNQSRKEQVDTFIHEIGHVFGLRHFFADVGEKAWPSVVFGKHSTFSIMNYGADSELTDADKADLKRLYELAWSGKLTDINGTPLVFVQPYHYLSANRNFGSAIC